MMKCIVTGANGHIGNTLIEQLYDSGYTDITGVVLPKEEPNALERFKDKKLKVVKGDILDKEFLEKLITPECLVFHLAGIIDISSDKKNDLIYKVNVDGTKNVAAVCKKNKVRMVYTSTVHIIVPKSKKEVMKEPTEFFPDTVVGDYAKSKTKATQYLLKEAKAGQDVVIVYPSGVIGPNDYNISNFGQLVLDLINKDITARVNGAYNFVDVRDLCRGMIAAAQKAPAGEHYLLSGNRITVEEVFDIVNGHLQRKKKLPLIAMWFVKMFAKLAEFYYKARHKKPLFTTYSLYTLGSNCYFDNSKAKQQLDFTVRPAKDSLTDAADWFLKNKFNLIKPHVVQELKKKGIFVEQK